MKFRLFVAVVIILLSLSACTRDYPPPAPLANSGFLYQAHDTAPLAIALDASGTSHIASLECRTDDPDDCRVFYRAMQMGQLVNDMIWPPSTGLYYQHPDVAVTDSGLAVTVFQACEISTDFCGTWMLRSDNDLQAWVVEPGKHVRGRPLVVSRGEVIYVVHEVLNDNGSALRFCRVTDQPYECHWVSAHPTPDNLFRTDQAAAVSSLGTLHTSYLVKAANGAQAYYADNAGDTTRDMTDPLNHQRNLGSVESPDVFFHPALAVETDDDYAYIALGVDQPTSDLMAIHYVSLYTAAETGAMSFSMPATQAWYIYGQPVITANASQANIAFSAITTIHPDEGEIYRAGYTVGDSDTPPTVPYPTSLGTNLLDCDPVITLLDDFYVIGWHICSPYEGRDTVYFYSILGGQVIHSPATFMDGRGGLDMAANGAYVAGIWNELYTDVAGEKLHTWLAYNANMLWLPVVTK